MTHPNIKLVQDIYAAFGRGDLAFILDAVHPDITWGLVGSPEDVPMAGIRSGKAGVTDFFKCLKETQQLTAFTPTTFAAGDDTVFVLGHAAWIMHSNGTVGDNPWVHVFVIKGGKVVSYRGFQDTALLAKAHHAPARKAG
jgi:ketosteroid isomerase-like protein